MSEYKNADIEELYEKSKMLNSMYITKWSVYDKVSKTQIYLEILPGHSHVFRFGLKLRGYKKAIYFKFKDGITLNGSRGFTDKVRPMREALDIALTNARETDIRQYILESEDDFVLV